MVIIGIFFSFACNTFPDSSSGSFAITINVFLLTDVAISPPFDNILFSKSLFLKPVITIFFKKGV